MRQFWLFILGLITLFILISSLGPMILLGVCGWLLYIIFKQFIQATNIWTKVLWVLLGLFILSIGLSNIYGIIGIAAAFFLYWIYRNWDDDSSTDSSIGTKEDSTLNNFGSEWEHLFNKYN